MTNKTPEHPLDRLLCQAAGDPTATTDDRRVAERALDQAIHGEARSMRGSARPRQLKAVPAFATLFIVTAVLLVAVGIQITRPPSAAAALAEIAEAAELAKPLEIPNQSYAYTRSENTVLGVAPPDAFGDRTAPLAYLAHDTRETWVGPDGTVQIRVTTLEPEFFSTADEVDYYSAGLDRIDRVGEAVTATGVNVTTILNERDWPTNPTDLAAAIVVSLPADHDEPDNVAIANLALVLVTETGASPELRAGALILISKLDDIELLERRNDGGGIFAMAHDAPTPMSLTFTLDGNGSVLQITRVDIDGNAALGVPPGTTIQDSRYSETRVVEGLNSP